MLAGAAAIAFVLGGMAIAKMSKVRRPPPPAASAPVVTPLPLPVVQPPHPAEVETKYRKVAEEYAAFRKTHGARLETEWKAVLDADRAGHPQRLDAALTSFRQRMHEIARAP